MHSSSRIPHPQHNKTKHCTTPQKNSAKNNTWMRPTTLSFQLSLRIPQPFEISLIPVWGTLVGEGCDWGREVKGAHQRSRQLAQKAWVHGRTSVTRRSRQTAHSSGRPPSTSVACDSTPLGDDDKKQQMDGLNIYAFMQI